MKTFSQNLKRVAVVSGLFLGAFTLSVLAESWTAAPMTAPDGNTPAPINVGGDFQKKEGKMAIGAGLSVGKITEPSSGYILDVPGSGLFDGIRINGKTSTHEIQIGDVTAGGDKQIGYVLTKTNMEGDAGWSLPSTSVGALNVSASVSLNPNEAGYDKKCSTEGGVCNRNQNLGVQSFCALTSQYVQASNSGSFNQGDGVSCDVSQDSTTKEWTLKALRSTNNTEVGITCRATCFGGGAITGAINTVK